MINCKNNYGDSHRWFETEMAKICSDSDIPNPYSRKKAAEYLKQVTNIMTLQDNR